MAENCLVRVPLRCFTRIENVGTLQAEAKLHCWPDRVQVRRLRLVSVLICPVLLWISRLCCLTSRRSQPPLAPFSSAVAVHAASRRWLSFLRYTPLHIH